MQKSTETSQYTELLREFTAAEQTELEASALCAQLLIKLEKQFKEIFPAEEEL